jgi:hypothetical protein
MKNAYYIIDTITKGKHMNKKRVLLLTGTTSDLISPHNNKMEEVFDLTLASKQRYSKKYGYDLLEMRCFGNGEAYGFKDTDIGFLKALRAFQMLEHYDLVMWIDADAIITNDSYSIEHFPIEKNSFCASYDWAWKESFSTGNFIIQRTGESNQLFDTFLQIGKQCSGRMMQEQEVLNYIQKNTPLKSTMKSLEHKFLNAVPSFITETPTWKADINRTGIVSPWNEDCFLAHLTGCTNSDRINLLHNKFANHL